ncbi:MAG TPA: hypothetical protein VLA46_03030, partial [Saprospiraceae bacterium]|nr:hypothetical protein [Saprospiraceae bacterium]
MRLSIFCFIIIVISVEASAQDYRRWEINEDGSISWMIKGDIPHKDHIEMSGKQISCVLRYGVAADGSFELTRSLVWPMLRTIPNNTHASLNHRFEDDPLDLIRVDGQPLPSEKVSKILLNGAIETISSLGERIRLIRQLFPLLTAPGYCEIYHIENISSFPVTVEV